MDFLFMETSARTLQDTPVPAATRPEKAGRLQNIDLLKGFLVLLVILGHTLSGEAHESLLKYTTIIFRMPLLIGLSGFMFSYQKIRTYSLPEVFDKYKTRLIIPWVLAVVFYTIFLNVTKVHGFNLQEIGAIAVNGFIFPFSHLWYIIGLFSWIVMTWGFAKLRFKLTHVLIVTALLCPVLLLFHRGTFEWKNPVAEFVVYSIRPYYYFFFILGVYLKSTDKLAYAQRWHRYAIVGAATALFLLFYFFNVYAYALLVVMFNTFLLMIVLDLARANRFFSNRLLEWAGRNSLAIYLWHPVPILILASIVGRDKPLLFYSLSFVTEVLLLYGIFQFSKVRFVRTYFFGLK
jgi:peptidoglycan/LPS O-acetylase OafA/YrhL